jgi:hypothetical protein
MVRPLRRAAHAGLDQDSGHLGSPSASSGHPGLTPSGLEALTTHAAGRDDDQGPRAGFSNSKFEGPLRPMVDGARTTDVLNPEHRAARLIHPTKLKVL